MKYMKWTMMITVFLVFAMFSGCAGGAQENDQRDRLIKPLRKKRFKKILL